MPYGFHSLRTNAKCKMNLRKSNLNQISIHIYFWNFPLDTHCANFVCCFVFTLRFCFFLPVCIRFITKKKKIPTL